MSESIILTIQSLPAELHLQICSYLNGYQTYKAFYGLNNRFSSLALSKLRQGIDLTQVKLYECHKFFSTIDRSSVTTLKLSNRFTDKQIDQLFDESLPHLRFLTLDCMGVFTMHNMMNYLSSLKDLEVLSISFKDGQCKEKLFPILRTVFKICSSQLHSLRKLSISQSNDDIDEEPTIDDDPPWPGLLAKNDSLQHFCLTTSFRPYLNDVMSNLPNLHSLVVTTELDPITLVYPTMIHLRRCTLNVGESTFESIVCALTNCPNLRHLSLQMFSVVENILNDQEWQDTIERYLPQLKQFKIDSKISSIFQTEVERLYKNSFWQGRKTTVQVVDSPACSEEPPTIIHITIQFKGK